MLSWWTQHANVGQQCPCDTEKVGSDHCLGTQWGDVLTSPLKDAGHYKPWAVEHSAVCAQHEALGGYSTTSTTSWLPIRDGRFKEMGAKDVLG